MDRVDVVAMALARCEAERNGWFIAAGRVIDDLEGADHYRDLARAAITAIESYEAP
jgi:hypothetical protein